MLGKKAINSIHYLNDSRKKTQKKMTCRVQDSRTKIQQFYENKSILITGGTGFLGKVLVEKLLRSCPGIRQIYLLVRGKNGICAEERLNTLLDDVVFERLSKEQPKFKDKLTLLHGDLDKPLLGLRTHDITTICHNVDVVFHAAATIRFDENLSIAVRTNVSATRQLCLLAQDIQNLKAVVYVSTAYSNCDVPYIQERVYEPPICPETLIQLSELLDDTTLDRLSSNLIGSKPNTYVFTKCVAEEVVHRFMSSLPAAIIRPSIVVAALAEPIAGWINNLQGPTGAVVYTTVGLLRTVLCRDGAAANMVPVDYTANAIIALGYYLAENSLQSTGKERELSVVNLVSTTNNTLNWRQFSKMMIKYARLNPSQNLLWYPFLIRAQSPLTAVLHRTVTHHLPAKIIDFFSPYIGHPTRFGKLYQRLHKYTQAVSYFSTRHFDFEQRNASRLWQQLEPQDQLLFPFNMANMDWNVYMDSYVQGCRRFLLNEDPATLKAARRKVKVFFVAHTLTKISIVFAGLKLLGILMKMFRKTMYRSYIQLLL